LEEVGEAAALFHVAVIILGADQYGGAVVDIAVVVVGPVEEEAVSGGLAEEVSEVAVLAVVGNYL
jgi:hypothetical protein